LSNYQLNQGLCRALAASIIAYPLCVENF